MPSNNPSPVLDNGETAVVDAPEVHRQKPQLAPQATADAKSTPQPTQVTGGDLWMDAKTKQRWAILIGSACPQ